MALSSEAPGKHGQTSSIQSGPVNVQVDKSAVKWVEAVSVGYSDWRGLFGDGINDDTAAVQDALDKQAVFFAGRNVLGE